MSALLVRVFMTDGNGDFFVFDENTLNLCKGKQK